MLFTLKDRTVRLSAGTRLLLPLGTDYNVITESDCDFCYFHFKADAWNDPAKERKDPARPDRLEITVEKALPAERERYEHLAMRGVGFWSTAKEFDKSDLDITLFQLLLLLAREECAPVPFTKNAANSTYLAIREYVRLHYSEPISLTSVSHEIGVSPQYAARIFRAGEGCSITTFIERTRLSQAETLLRDTHVQITQIAFAVGFSSPYYFCRRFTAAHRVSPTAYRQAAMRE